MKGAEQQRLLEKAKENIQAAQLLTEQGYGDIAASRAYYAMFYVCQALLVQEGLSFSSHSAVIAAFGKEFAKTGRIDARFHRYLIDSQDLRTQSDYQVNFEISPEKVKTIIQWAQEFFDEISPLINDS